MADRKRTKAFMEKWLNFGVFPGSDLGERETGFRHRTYYHKMFRGFTEIRRVNQKGRVVIERVYTAPWLRHNMENWQWVLTKAGYVLGAVVSSVLFLWATTRQAISNYSAIVAAPGFLSGLMLLLWWVGVLAYVSAPRKMTLWEYESGRGKIKLFTRLFAAGAALTAVAKVVFIGIWLHFSFEGEVGSIVALLASVVPPVLTYLAERGMKYDQIANENAVEEEERYEIL